MADEATAARLAAIVDKDPGLAERAGVPIRTMEDYEKRPKQGLVPVKRTPRDYAEAMYPHLIKE